MFLKSVFSLAILWGISAQAMISSKKLDILFIVDDSGSMELHQRNMANALSAVQLALTNLDVNAAVITTSVAKKGNYVAPIRNSADTSFIQDLQQDIQVGVRGDYQEQPFASLLLNISPYLSPQGETSAFFRGDADLLLVILTDAEDQSGVLEVELAQKLRMLKGAQQIFVLAGMPDRSNASCPFEQEEPTKITSLVNDFNGEVFDICSTPSFTVNFRTALVNAISIP